MGLILQMEKRYEEALNCLNESQKMCERIGEVALKGAILVNIAAVKYHRKDYKRALELLQESLAICEKLGDERGRAKTVQNMGDAYQALGKAETALNYYREALKVWERIEYAFGAAETHFNMGVLFLRELSKPAEALPHFQAAVEAFEKVRSSQAEVAREAIRSCLKRIADELTAELIATLRRIDRESLDSIWNRDMAERYSMNRRLLWDRAIAIGKHLQELGGLELMHTAVKQVRQVSAGLSDALEDAWSSVKGYQRRRWLLP